MDSIEERVNEFADKWQDYCLPDKHDQLKPQIGELAAELDKFIAEASTACPTQTTARRRRPSCTT